MSDEDYYSAYEDYRLPLKHQGQSHLGSLVESITNILIGVGVSFASQLVIFGMYGIHLSAMTNFKLTCWFTAVSLTRSFVLRRIFNRITLWRNTNLSSTKTGSLAPFAVAGNNVAIVDASTGLTTESGTESSSSRFNEISQEHTLLGDGWGLR